MRLSLLRGLLLAACLLPLLGGCVTYVTPPQTQAQTQTEMRSGPATTPSSGSEVIVSGGEGTDVLVEGTAALTEAGTADIARDHAIKDALRKAVEQGVGTYINSESRVQNFQLLSDRIYSQASGYVSSYKVLSESQEGGMYRVAIRAKVKLDRLQDDLSAIGILVEEQGRPRIMVVVKELANPDDITIDDALMSQQMLETMILDAFQSKGFPVVDAATVETNLKKDQLKLILDGDTRAAQLLGMKAGAEVIITGTAQRSSERKAVPYSGAVTDFYKLKISARAINTATAAVMGASAFAREVPFSEDEARRQTADSAATKLMNDILGGWKKHSNAVEIHATNADYAKVLKLKSEILSKVRGVTNVVQRDLTGTTALLEVVSESSPQEVLDDLGTKKFTVPFEIKGFENNRIEIKFGDAPAVGAGGSK